MDKQRKVEWVILTAIMLLAAFVRWNINDTDYLVAGVDGTYYPLQVRSIIENLRLGYPDMPLTFLIQALFSKIFMLFALSADESILLSVRVVDSFLPPLAVIPVFLISQELTTKTRRGPIYLSIAFSVLNLCALLLASTFIKNSLAIVLVFFHLLYVIRFLKYQARRNLYFSLGTLVLCLLTHFGSFALLLSYAGLIGALWLWYNRGRFERISFRKIAGLLLVLLLLLLLIGLFDRARLFRMLHLPFRVFEAPTLLLVLKGFHTSYHGYKLFYLLGASLVSLVSLCLVIAGRNKMDALQKALLTASALLTLFLSCPLVGTEWFERLSNMSYVPLTLLFLLLFSTMKNKWGKYALFTLCFVFVFFPYVRGLPPPKSVSIEKTAFSELEEMRDKDLFDANDMIIARQDLRMIAGWVFRTKTSADFAFTRDDFAKYESVFILKQVGKDFEKNESAQFKEAFIPPDTRLIYKGENFEVYRLENMNHWNIGFLKPLKIFGKIAAMDGNRLLVQNDKVARPVELLPGTRLFLSSRDSLVIGMYIQVWGEDRLFELTIDAEDIQEISDTIPQQ